MAPAQVSYQNMIDTHSVMNSNYFQWQGRTNVRTPALSHISNSFCELEVEDDELESQLELTVKNRQTINTLF